MFLSTHPNFIYLVITAVQLLATVVIAGSLVSIARSLKRNKDT